MVYGYVFLNISVSEKYRSVYCIKITKSRFALKNIPWGDWNDKLQTRRELLTNYISDKELESRIYEKVSKLNSKNTI